MIQKNTIQNVDNKSSITYDKNLHIEKKYSLSKSNLETQIDSLLNDLLLKIKLNGFRKLSKKDLEKSDEKSQKSIKKRKSILFHQQQDYVIENAKHNFINEVIKNDTDKMKNVLSFSRDIINEELVLTYDLYDNLQIRDIKDVKLSDYKIKDLDKLVLAEFKELENKSFELIEQNEKIKKTDQIKLQIKFFIYFNDKIDKQLSILVIDSIENDFLTQEDIFQHKKGDSFEKFLTVTPYLLKKYSFLQDKKIKMYIKVLDVKFKKMIPFTDDVVYSTYNLDSIEKLKEVIKNNNIEKFDNYKKYLFEQEIVDQLNISANVSVNLFDKYKIDVTKESLQSKFKLNIEDIVNKKIKISLMINYYQKLLNVTLDQQDVISFFMKNKNMEMIQRYQQNQEFKNYIDNQILNRKILDSMISKAKKTSLSISMEEIENKIENIENKFKQL